MAKYAGKDLILKVHTASALTGAAFATVGGASSHTYTYTESGADTTDKDSSAWGEMSPFGRRGIEIAFNGFVSDNANFALLEAQHASATPANLAYEISYGNSKTVKAFFHMSSFEVTGEVDGAQTFSIALTSSGQPTFA